MNDKKELKKEMYKLYKWEKIPLADALFEIAYKYSEEYDRDTLIYYMDDLDKAMQASKI
jgi:hypothetical protein